MSGQLGFASGLLNNEVEAVAAAQALGKIGDSAAIPFLLRVVKWRPVENDPWAGEDLRRAATEALTRLGDPRGREQRQKELIQLLQCTHEPLRMGWTMHELGELGDRRALPALENILKHPRSDVREDAERAIENIRSRTGN